MLWADLLPLTPEFQTEQIFPCSGRPCRSDFEVGVLP
jgi:hypothetical protein